MKLPRLGVEEDSGGTQNCVKLDKRKISVTRRRKGSGGRVRVLRGLLPVKFFLKVLPLLSAW